MSELFEQAARGKYRYDSPRGMLTTEDLWDLPLQSTHSINLDDMAQELDRELTASAGRSRINPSTTNTALVNKLAVIDYIIDTKLAEAETRKQAAAAALRIETLTGVLAERELEADKAMSTKDIKKELRKLT